MFEIISETNYTDFDIIYVNANTPQEALIKFCEYTNEIKPCYINAMKNVSFQEALEIARDNLYFDIVCINKINDYSVYFKNDEKYRIDMIE